MRIGHFGYSAALAAAFSLSAAVAAANCQPQQLGEETQGRADLAAAGKLDSGVAKRFADVGLAP